MRIGITGAAGQIGRLLVEALEGDHELVLMDSSEPQHATIFDPDAPGGRRSVPFVTNWPYHVVDISRQETLDTLLDGLDVVVHLAAVPTGRWVDAETIMRVNVTGTFNLFRSAQRSGVRRVVAASSINAFGSMGWRVRDNHPIRTHLPLEEDDPRVPEDPYSLSKGMGEDIAATFERAFGMETVNLRFAEVWPEEKYDSALRDGLPATTAWADDLFQWVHIRDVVAGLVAAVTSPSVIGLPIVLAAGDTRAPEPSLDLVERFAPQLLTRLREPIPGRAPLLSIRRARTVLGFQPAYRLD